MLNKICKFAQLVTDGLDKYVDLSGRDLHIAFSKVGPESLCFMYLHRV